PLVDDLYTLFETWVDTYDASTKENFNLCAFVLWTINDYPGLGGKIQKQKRKTTEEEGSSSQVNEAYWKKFNIWYRKLRKEISLQELDKMQEELVVTLRLLEKFFPPSFFDIMIHLTMHLTRE
nr:putative transposon, En/Spm-like protein [Tanacetum cinerariifolium]